MSENIVVVKNACPVCGEDVKGNDKHNYFCKRCNLMFDRMHLLKPGEMHAEKQVIREKGYLYFIDKEGDVSRVKMAEEIKRVSKEFIISVFSEEARDTQLELYKRLDLKGIKEKDNIITTTEGLYSKRFTKEELERLFKGSKIEKFTDISYLVIGK